LYLARNFNFVFYQGKYCRALLQYKESGIKPRAEKEILTTKTLKIEMPPNVCKRPESVGQELNLHTSNNKNSNRLPKTK